jgi:2-polyprenyl-3-methyl-5-hydroxy-6-metoxy-1,4-benzoquinol methylase
LEGHDVTRPDGGKSFESVSLDAVREYWNRRPCNVRHSPRAVGSIEYFNEVEARRYFVEPHIPSFADFGQWAGKRVLEIGCGIGTDTIAFARAGASVTAVDLSSESVALAERRAAVFGLEDRINFFVADAEHLAEVVPPEPYDLVYSFGVIHHTPRPESVLQQIRESYVHDGSTLKLMLYHRWSWKVLAILVREGHLAYWRLDKLIARSSEAQTGCPVTYSYSAAGATDMLERHGFRVDDVAIDMIFPYRIADYVEYRYVKEWYFRWMPHPLFRAFEKRLGWHLCLTAKPSPFVTPVKA